VWQPPTDGRGDRRLRRSRRHRARQKSRTGIDRRDGFLNRIKEKYPNIKIVSVKYGGGDYLKSAEIAKAMIQVTRISRASAVTTAGRCGIVGRSEG
jgi:hypothetical protein